MKLRFSSRRLSLVSVIAVITLLAISSRLPTIRSVLAGQGKGGEVVAKPTPTPKKTTTKRTVPARTPNNAKTNQATKPVGEAASAAELVFWNSIKDSTNSEDFNFYLKKYPNGEFSTLARNRLNALETAAKEAAARKEEAKRQDEEAAKKRPGAVVKNGIGMEFVWIPPGTFMMGPGRNSQGHPVTIREGFYMGRYEVTQAQWQAVMGDNRSDIKGDNLPMNVSWNSAQAFISKLNTRGDEYLYRLPSEAEWEYAARAGTTTTYFWGEDVLQACRYANVRDQSAKEAGTSEGVIIECRDGYAKASPVGSFQPNAFGLYDMIGNVQEWCEDSYYDYLYGRKYRIKRGGFWNSPEGELRSSYRDYQDPGPSNIAWGFRIVAVGRTQQTGRLSHGLN